MIAIIRTLWLVKEYDKAAPSLESTQTKEGKDVKFAMEEKNSVLVKIQLKERDNRELIEETDEVTGKKTGKKIKNKMYGKFVYKTIEGGTIELFEATGPEVKEAVLRGLHAAAGAKK